MMTMMICLRQLLVVAWMLPIVSNAFVLSPLAQTTPNNQFSLHMVRRIEMLLSWSTRKAQLDDLPSSLTSALFVCWFSRSFGQAAESEVSFDGDLDGSKMRIGIIRTRWNNEYVDKLVAGIKEGCGACKVSEENIFETSVPGSFELPLAAKFLALSGTVDAIVCCGVLIKGETMHFEYIADAVAKGLMNIGIQTTTPIVLGVLTCLNEEQVAARSGGKHNHGIDWGKTAVEMALLRTEALGGKASDQSNLSSMGFGVPEPLSDENAKKKTSTFF